MDVANGGVNAHGGFHRVFGGHSFTDLEFWKRFGIKFPKEILVDSLTPNGTPLPGIETLTKMGLISPSDATNWGSLNIGDALGASVAMIDTGLGIVRIYRDDSSLDDKTFSLSVKGTVKIAAGAGHGNILLIAAGITDLSLAARSAIRSSINLVDPEDEIQIGFSFASTY